VRVAAVILLTGLLLVPLGDAFLHTDDGCAVETHCLTCRWAYATAVMAPPVFTLAPGAPLCGTVASCPREPSQEPRRDELLSRGPPLV
jgi:hypothetical protein